MQKLLSSRTWDIPEILESCQQRTGWMCWQPAQVILQHWIQMVKGQIHNRLFTSSRRADKSFQSGCWKSTNTPLDGKAVAPLVLNCFEIFISLDSVQGPGKLCRFPTLSNQQQLGISVVSSVRSSSTASQASHHPSLLQQAVQRGSGWLTAAAEEHGTLL